MPLPSKNPPKISRVFKLYHVLFYTTHFTVGRCFTLAEGDRSCLKCFVTKCHSVFQAPHGNSDGAAHLLRDKKLELYVKLYKIMTSTWHLYTNNRVKYLRRIRDIHIVVTGRIWYEMRIDGIVYAQTRTWLRLGDVWDNINKVRGERGPRVGIPFGREVRVRENSPEKSGVSRRCELTSKWLTIRVWSSFTVPYPWDVFVA